MTMIEAAKLSLSRYAQFSGRARRAEFWWFALAQFLALVLSYMVLLAVPVLGTLLYLVVVLGTFIPHLAVTIRRLHDANRSGWWYFIGLVPFVGAILLFVWFCSKGTDGSNQFGDDPKALAMAIA
jgi:uncharacterized membrane protein YhaH (DUF805 family)